MERLRLGVLAKAAFAAGVAMLVFSSGPVSAGAYNDRSGDFLVRILGSYIYPDAEVDSLYLNKQKLGSSEIKVLGAEVDKELVPTATFTYFLDNNWALELFCCASPFEVTNAGGLLDIKKGTIAEGWIFPPALTLQYHFDLGPSLKPYLGVGVQYIHFFPDDLDKDNRLYDRSYRNIDMEGAIGPVVQAGIDFQISDRLYLNADVKKSWLGTEVEWTGDKDAHHPPVRANVSLDPWIFSVGIGYRFGLGGDYNGLK